LLSWGELLFLHKSQNTKGSSEMRENVVLKRFKKFKNQILSADIPSNILLEMVESYLTSDDDNDTATVVIPVLEGQLTLFDYELCA